MQLFRKQALDAQNYRLYGDVLAKPGLSHGLLGIFLITWFFAGAFWLGNSTYAKRETVQGWLQPDTGITRVTAPPNAMIEQVLVAEGESVSTGQPLLVLRQARTLLSGEQLEKVLLRQFQERQSTLEQSLHRGERQFEEVTRQAQRDLASSKRNLQHLEQQAELLAQRSKLQERRHERVQRLVSSGHLPQASLDEAQLSALEVRRSIASLNRERETTLRDIRRQESELRLLPQRAAEAAAGLHLQLNELSQRITEFSGSQAFTITASRAGVIHNLQARPGQQAGLVQGPLLSISETTSALEATLLVPVRAIGFIEQGQRVNIHYHAFPHQKFGSFVGTVSRVGGSALLPREVGDAPIAIDQAVFRVAAQIEQQEVQAQGLDFKLLPGMTFSADISLGERTLLQWLLSPVYALRGRLV